MFDLIEKAKIRIKKFENLIKKILKANISQNAKEKLISDVQRYIQDLKKLIKANS